VGAICILGLGLCSLLFQGKLLTSESTYFVQAANDLWDSYDRIVSLLLDFNDIWTRINFLQSVDHELLLGIVYMQAFEHLLKFVGIVTQYARDKGSGMLIANVTNSSELCEAFDW
jgi:hypothetical protein